MNTRYFVYAVLLTGLVMLAAWGAGVLWPEQAHFIRNFFRELLRALL